MMKSTWKKYWTTTAIAIIAISPVLLSAPVTAQSITAAQDGTNTVVLPNGQQFDITGGTQAGANLFHSFQQFGLSQGQIANFLSQPNIQNILGRVVGGDPSVINGLIQLTGGNSNLYIMNPAGVIFGANASLNVPASFTAATANGIQVGNSWFGINTIASDLKNLTGTPNAFAFTSPTTALTQGQTSGVIVNQGNLSVSQGRSITLVGGIVINTGTIQSPNGNINIVAVPDGKYVRITPEGGVLSLDLAIATQQALGNTTLITGIDLPKLLTGSGIVATTKAGESIVSGSLDVSGNNGGKIQVLGNSVSLVSANLNASGFNGGGTVLVGGDYQGTGTTPKSQTTTVDANSVINVDALTNGNGGTAIVWSDGKTIFDGTITAKGGTLSGNGGLIETSGKDTLVVGNNAKVNTSALQGEIGTWLLDPTTITVVASGGTDPTVAAANANTGASTINNSVIVAALNGTNVTLTATNAITVNALIDSSANAGAGDLTLNAPTTNLNAGITLRAGSTLSGNATTVNVGAAGLVQNGVDAAAAGATVNLATATYVLGGQVNIAKSLTLSGNGSANTIIDGNGAVTNNRVFNITANVPVTFNGVTIRNGRTTGDGGSIFSNGAVTITNSNVSGNVSTNTGGLGGGGGIFSNGDVTLTNSTVSGNTSANRGGGINSRSGVVTLTNSIVSGNTATQRAGGIYALGGGTMTLTNSTLSGNTSGTTGGGIFSNGGAIIFTNTTVSGNKADAGGGIFSNGVVTLTNSTVSGNTATSDGGGIWGVAGGTVRNSTITNNTVTTGNGGGIYRSGGGGTFTITNSIVAGNFKGVTVQDLGSSAAGIGFTNGGNNIIGANDGFAATFATSALVGTIANPVNPQLAPLANNGGPTQTHALLPNSPALDAGNNAKAPVGNDQRGLPRISGNNVDIGAFEFQVIPPVVTPLTTTPIQFSIARGGFGGVFPSREDLEGRSARLDEQDLDISFTQVLCLDPSLAITQTTSIPTCKKQITSNQSKK